MVEAKEAVRRILTLAGARQDGSPWENERRIEAAASILMHHVAAERRAVEGAISAYLLKRATEHTACAGRAGTMAAQEIDRGCYCRKLALKVEEGAYLEE